MLAEIKAVRNQGGAIKNGEMPRLVLDILGDAQGPLMVPEISAVVPQRQGAGRRRLRSQGAACGALWQGADPFQGERDRLLESVGIVALKSWRHALQRKRDVALRVTS